MLPFSLSSALQSGPSKILFLFMLVLRDFSVSFVFHKPPVILIFAFVGMDILCFCCDRSWLHVVD